MDRKIRLAINGFGRIGRTVTRFLTLDNRNIELVAINDLAPAATLAHLFEFDSIHRIFPGTVDAGENSIIINGKEIPVLAEKNPANLPWNEMDIDVVIESTGLFKRKAQAEEHLKAGAKRVIISAVSPDENLKTIVLGANDSILDGNEKVISNASCTTNSAAPLVKVVDALCEIESGFITTVHSYTSDQSLHDRPHNDLRRARAAALSIVPTTTGAAKAITRVFPHLVNKIGGAGIRVPVPNGSLTDITYIVKNPKSIEEINAAFKEASEGELKGYLQYTEKPLVSVDILTNRHSCIFDAQLTAVIGNMVKVVGWYDNEAGYSSRLLDLAEKWVGLSSR